MTRMSSSRLTALVAACAALTSLVLAAPSRAAEPAPGDGAYTTAQLRAELREGEVAALGRDEAEYRAFTRLVARGVRPGGPGNRAVSAPYAQSVRTARLAMLTSTQAETNKGFDPKIFGRFTSYFPSPEYGDHIAALPTGKVLLFSFEPVESDPTKEPAPTQIIGADNRGRAYLWDPAKGTGTDAFKSVPPPDVVLDDGTGVSRPAPFFCAGHSFLPNGMLGVFGGNFGGNFGTGAKLSLIFDPVKETWTRNPDMSVGRWYPSVVTGEDGRQLIMSGHSELGWGTPTPVVERFPAKSAAVPKDPAVVPLAPVDRFGATAPYSTDYPQLFSLNDGKIYGFGRTATEQWRFDPKLETRTDLPARPDAAQRNYGSAVALPGGFQGPDSVLLLGGNRDDPKTYLFSGGQWSEQKPRAFGRTQDDTLILPDGTLFTVNGAYDIRDYGNGPLNPNGDLKYRQTEMRDAQGNWRLGPVQRLPRGYHSNAVILADGRIAVTGDELQQIADNPDIKSGMNGSIEIYEPWYLNSGARPTLDSAPGTPLRYNSAFTVTTSTPDRVTRAVLLAPITSTHSVDTSQRHIELQVTGRSGGQLTLQTPPVAASAPPGYYMLFLLDAAGVPSVAKWVKLEAKDSGGQIG
ncbi:galactose oxidase early set domain-containing protein [Kitasatospora sp. NPDC002227]|uniref:galactose oxidase early set domain-containing protein n=1 Tax=Kitasatospora sp. NPDC002227 TaxID=3154773 RepID=UPI00332B38CA